MKGIGKKIVALGILAVLTLGIFLLSGCEYIYNTPESCEKPVRKLVEKNFVKTGKCESYTLYYLYDENDKLNSFMIDLHPNKGIIYVLADCPYWMTTLGGVWFRSSTQSEWSFYRLKTNGVEPDTEDGKWVSDTELSQLYIIKTDGTSEGTLQPNNDRYSYTDRYFLTNEQKMKTVYESYVSPYHIAGVLDEKLYLFGNGYNIPAIKRDGRFFNLLSLQYFDSVEGKGYEYLYLTMEAERGASPLCNGRYL